MRTDILPFACLLTLLSLHAMGEPIRLHPDNPHYFLVEERPAILLTSAEHYGAVINLDFDYVKYLDALQARGFNYTRIFSGSYREVAGSFGIERNTLGPTPDRYLCPWARADQQGDPDSGKYDLTQWDPAYFARLKDFLGEAGQRGIVVELSLFCPFYDKDLWAVNPMNAANNVNGAGTCDSEKAYTLENGDLLAVQEAMTRKLVEELNGFDNIFYEICNEPYFGGVTLDWQARIADVIAMTEKDLPKRHLIAQNIANIYQKIETPNPLVSIFNFHYAKPESVTDNLGLGCVLGYDESGFAGVESEPYRIGAWQFLMAGGGIFNNLDWTYTAQSPEGLDTANNAPGSTTTEIRDQLVTLRRFFDEMDFIHMQPAPDSLQLKAPDGVAVQALSGDKLIAAYLVTQANDPGSVAEMSLELPAGKWTAEWISPVTGETVQAEKFSHDGGTCVLKMPSFTRDLALRLTQP